MTLLEIALLAWANFTNPETGIASVYSISTNNNSTIVACPGRKLSDGDLVAAHKTLPCGTKLMVLNLDNALSVDVVIIDRGPYISGRIIDLSVAAARAIQLPGLGPVAITKR